MTRWRSRESSPVPGAWRSRCSQRHRPSSFRWRLSRPSISSTPPAHLTAQPCSLRHRTSRIPAGPVQHSYMVMATSCAINWLALSRMISFISFLRPLWRAYSLCGLTDKETRALYMSKVTMRQHSPLLPPHRASRDFGRITTPTTFHDHSSMARRATKKTNRSTNAGPTRPPRQQNARKAPDRGVAADSRASADGWEDLQEESTTFVPASAPIAMTLRPDACGRTLRDRPDAAATLRACPQEELSVRLRAVRSAIARNTRERGPGNAQAYVPRSAAARRPFADALLDPPDVMDQAWSLRRRVAALGPELPPPATDVHDSRDDGAVFSMDLDLDPALAPRPQPPDNGPCECAECLRWLRRRRRFMSVRGQPGF